MLTHAIANHPNVLDDLDADRQLARDLGQPSAAIQATQLRAKLVGLLVDRKESDAPGDFAAMQTADEVMALVRQELGEETAAALAAALAKQDEPAENPLETSGFDATRDEGSTLN